MDRDFENKLLKKFDTVIKLLTISSLKDETQVQKIKILNSAGLQPKDIADLLGTSSNTVSVALSKIKSKNKIPDQKEVTKTEDNKDTQTEDEEKNE